MGRLLLQIFGISVFLLPLHIALLGWKWVARQQSKVPGFGCAAAWRFGSVSRRPADWRRGIGLLAARFAQRLTGLVLADFLLVRFNLAGAAIITVASGSSPCTLRQPLKCRH